MTHHVQGVIQALFRQRVAFWAVVLGALAAAGAASVLLTPMWRAQATLLVPQAAGDAGGIDLLASRDLHRQVVTRLGAATLYPGLDDSAAAIAFEHDLAARPGSGETVVVTYDSRDGLLAARVLESTIAVFGEQRGRLLAQASGGALEQQAALYKTSLDEARRRLEAYRQDNNVWAVDEERHLLMRQRSDIDSDLKRTINLQDELAAKMRTLRSQMTQTPTTVEAADQAGRYKVVDETKARLLELQLKEQELLSKYKDTSQFVVTVRDEIRRVQAFLDDMSSSMNQRNKPAANEVYVEMSKELLRAETQHNSAQGRRAALEGQLGEIDRRLGQINARSGELIQLEQAVERGEADLRRVHDARVSLAVDASQGNGLAVIERPAASARPVRPDPVLYFKLAVPCGLLGGLCLALLAEAFSTTFAAPGEVERRLGLPVLAVLPYRP